jgi:hypothetical protein
LNIDLRNLSDASVEARLGQLTDTIEQATVERATLLRLAASRYPEGHPDRWTQDRLAKAARISQPAVSKTLKGETERGPAWHYGVLLRAYRDLAASAGRAGDRAALDVWDKLEPQAIAAPTVLTMIRHHAARWLKRSRDAKLRERIDQAAAAVDLTLLPSHLPIRQQSEVILGYHYRQL